MAGDPLALEMLQQGEHSGPGTASRGPHWSMQEAGRPQAEVRPSVVDTAVSAVFRPHWPLFPGCASVFAEGACAVPAPWIALSTLSLPGQPFSFLGLSFSVTFLRETVSFLPSSLTNIY